MRSLLLIFALTISASSFAEGGAFYYNPSFHFCNPGFNSKCLLADQTLVRGDWLSSGSLKLLLQPNGNLELLINNSYKLWESKTANKGVTKGTMQADGNFVLYDAKNKSIWSTKTSGYGGSYLELEEKNVIIGNILHWAQRFVIYSPVSVWSSKTADSTRASEAGAAIFSKGQVLAVGQFIKSGNEKYQLLLDGTGNLVLLNVNNGLVRWQSKTAGKGVVKATLKSDGNFVLLDAADKIVWKTNTVGYLSARLALQNDGNLVLYSTQTMWSSDTKTVPSNRDASFSANLFAYCFGEGFTLGRCPYATMKNY